MTERTKVLYITGWLRSGTTLLGNVLNELPGVVHAGELHYLWRNGMLRSGTNSVCGCGTQVRECPLWSSVTGLPAAGAMGDAGDAVSVAERMVAAQHAHLRTRHTRARLAESRAGRPAPPAAAEVMDRTADLYRALAAGGGERLVVDGSKYPAEAAALIGRRDLDVRVLHMVRDPRAVALSHLSVKQYIEIMSPARSTGYWLGFNLASELVGAAAPDRYLRIRHEDFSADPAGVLGEVLAFAGLDDTPPVDSTGTVTLGVNHTVTGNPDRLARGATRIRSEERWRTDLPARHAATATAVALPLLARYRYPLAPAPSRARTGRESLTWTSD
ncbi:sulfotransferase [Sphaerisporangium sp. B11E5]|uniref:sulfotransferase n=1 Tax=Sphaerisporangium sp. B11E5 TaxID=3153563 RepID=UPI00325F916E